MQLRLAGPSTWSSEVARFERLPAEASRFADAVLWTLQDAHVGITPRLAADLARLFADHSGRSSALRTASGPAPAIWAKVLRQLQDGLPRTERSGFVAGNVPVYIVLKIVKPLVREASRRLGYACLLCHDEPASPMTSEEYAAYATALERELARAAEELTSAPMFVAEHGNVVAALSEPSPLGRSRARVPEIDRESLAMLLALTCDVDAPARASRRAPAPSYVPRSRPSPGDQEGRIEGVRFSRGEAHFGSIVLSEFLNHPVVLIDRLLNSGYLVHERRPRREKLRDVLVVGLMPPGVGATVGGSLTKACWLDCMARLGRLLSAARLGDSEFRWIEGDASGRAKCCSFPIGQLPADLVSRGHESFRSAFMTLLRWLPDYFDTRAGFRSLGTPRPLTPDEWAVAAWTANAREMEAFSFVHIMMFHPSIGGNRAAYAAGAKRLGALRAGLRLGYHPRRHTSVTYVTDERRQAGWHFGSNADPYRLLAAGDAVTVPRRLQASWLDQLTKEIWHG